MKKFIIINIMFLLILNIGLATEYLQTSHYRGTETESSADDRVWAMEFEVNENADGFYLINVCGSIEGTTDATRICVYNSSNKLGLQCSAISGKCATFDFQLNADDLYVLGWDNDGSNWNGMYNLTNQNYPKYPPEATNYINYTRGVYFEPPTNTSWTTYVGWLMLYNITLNDTGGGGGSPQGTLTINSNLANVSNYNENNINITYNGTVADTTNIFNCTLFNYTDTVETQLDKDLSNLQNFLVDVSNKEFTYEFSIYCNQSGEVNDTTTKHSYEVDNILPELSFTTTFSNNTQYTKDVTVSIGYSWTDSNFLASNVTWIDTDKTTVLQNEFIENASSGYSSSTSRVVNTAGYNFSIRFEAWDSHTGEYLKADPEQINDNIIGYKDILIISDKPIEYETKIDKVNFKLDKTTTQVCYYTQNTWQRIDNSQYPNHYVSIQDKVWVDDYDNDLELITDKQLCTKSIKSLEIKSIGDLNYKSQTYFYNVVSLESFYLNTINSNVILIYGVLQMIGIVLIWAFINIAAFSLLQKGQYLAGWWIYGFASFFDLFLGGYLVNTYQSAVDPSTFYGVTASFLMVACSVWIIIRVAIPFTYKTYSRR